MKNTLKAILFLLVLSGCGEANAEGGYYEFYTVHDQVQRASIRYREYSRWNGRFWERVREEVSRTPFPGTVKAPQAAKKEAPRPAPKQEVKAEPAAERKDEKKVTLPRIPFKDEEFRVLPHPTVPAEPKRATNQPLTAIEPAALRSLRWSDESTWKGNEEKDLGETLVLLKDEVAQWQNDFLSRFSLCFSGLCDAKRRGTYEDLSVPYQVAMGRVRILKLEIDYVSFLLSEGKTSPREIVPILLRVIRRYEAAETLLRDTAGLKERPYYETLVADMKRLKELSSRWNALTNDEEKGWVLRWQIVAQETQVWLDQMGTAKRVAQEPLKKKLEEKESIVREQLEKIGKAPWGEPLKDQNAIAGKIYAATSDLYSDYPKLASRADAHVKEGGTYLDLIAFLGANENLRNYSYNIERVTEPPKAE